MGQPNSLAEGPAPAPGTTLLEEETRRAGRLIGRHHDGWTVECHRFLDSTQAEARRRVTAGSPPDEPFLLVAGHQSEGRGRGERRWVAPEGKALLFTAAIPLARTAQGSSGLGRPLASYPPSLWPLQIGLTLFIRLWSFGWKAGVKWPNDLLVEGHKVGGILCEVRNGWLLAGVGLNLLQEAGDFPAGLEARVPPGSLAMFAEPGSPAPEQLAPTVLQSVVSVLEAPWSVEWMLEHYRKWCVTLGQHVILPNGTTGIARAIDDVGRLAVEKEDGTTEWVSSEVHTAPGGHQ